MATPLERSTPAGIAITHADMEASRGSMGSTVWRWRCSPEDLPEALERDWRNLGRRAWIEAGTVTLVSPSYSHERCSRHVDSIVHALANSRALVCEPAAGTRWFGPDRAVEADESYYLGEAARRLLAAGRAGSGDAFTRSTPPQLVIEVERTHGDAGKPELYRALGVPEFWRIDAAAGSALIVEFIELQHPDGPRPVPKSLAFPDLGDRELADILSHAMDRGIQGVPDLIARRRPAPDRETPDFDPGP